jgi:hypothetical protein
MSDNVTCNNTVVKRQKVVEGSILDTLKELKHVDRYGLNPPPRFTWNFAIYVELIEVINTGELGFDVIKPHNNSKLYDVLKGMEASKGFTIFQPNFETNNDYKNRFRKKVMETVMYLKRIAIVADSILTALNELFNDEDSLDKHKLFLIIRGDTSIKRMDINMTYLFYCLPFLIHRKYWDNAKTLGDNYISFNQLKKEDYLRELVRFVRDCVIAHKKNILI